MIKLAGAALLFFGTAGFSFSICREQRERLRLLKNLKYMYQLLQNEICYTGLPLPEIFRSISEKLEAPLKEALLEVSQSMTWEQGKSFQEVWESKISICLKGLPLTEIQKELLLKFPECTGISEREGQAKMLERYVRETDRYILQLETEEKSRNKVIMSLGIAAGIFIIIILL